MKKLLFAMLALVALASCSKDEVVQLNQDEIKFSVVTDNATKAENLYCANKYMSSFSVSADYTESGSTKMYITGDVITVSELGVCSYTNTRYWPDNGTLDFYAIVDGSFDANRTAGSAPTITDFVVDNDVTKQKDLMYAVEKSKQKTDGTVALNFRHALSLIEFKAHNQNTNIYVEISGVKVGRVNSKGTYTLPTQNTSGSNNTNNNDHSNDSEASLTRGSWSSTSVPVDYTITFETPKQVHTQQAISLTTTTDIADNKKFGNWMNSLLLIPTGTATTAWNPKTSSSKDSEGNVVYNGTYLAVKCDIYNIAGAEFDKDTDVKLYSDWAYIPVSFDWAEGKKYTYTFIFKTGSNGGKEPVDPNNPGEEPDDVLIPISYEVTIDDFQKGSSADQEVNWDAPVIDNEGDDNGDGDQNA